MKKVITAVDQANSKQYSYAVAVADYSNNLVFPLDSKSRSSFASNRGRNSEDDVSISSYARANNFPGWLKRRNKLE